MQPIVHDRVSVVCLLQLNKRSRILFVLNRTNRSLGLVLRNNLDLFYLDAKHNSLQTRQQVASAPLSIRPVARNWNFLAQTGFCATFKTPKPSLIRFLKGSHADASQVSVLIYSFISIKKSTMFTFRYLFTS